MMFDGFYYVHEKYQSWTIEIFTFVKDQNYNELIFLGLD